MKTHGLVGKVPGDSQEGKLRPKAIDWARTLIHRADSITSSSCHRQALSIVVRKFAGDTSTSESSVDIVVGVSTHLQKCFPSRGR